MTEMVVYMFIFALVSLGVASTFSIGNRWYDSSRAFLLSQEASLGLPSRLSRELMESHLSGIRFCSRTGTWSALPGIIFISARTAGSSDVFNVNPLTGNARWRKYVAYYATTDPENPAAWAVIRKEWVPSTLNPDGVPVACTRDTTWFATSNPSATQVVAHGITPSSSSLPNGGFDIYSGQVTRPSYDSPSNPITLHVQADSGYGTRSNQVEVRVQVNVRN